MSGCRHLVKITQVWHCRVKISERERESWREISEGEGRERVKERECAGDKQIEVGESEALLATHGLSAKITLPYKSVQHFALTNSK